MRFMRANWMVGVALVVAAAVATVAGMLAIPRPVPKPPKDFPIQLRDVSRDTGITFQHTDGGSGQRYIIESMSAGVATLDYDGDGLLDVYFVNGSPLQGTPAVDPPPANRLYRNLGGLRFEDVTDQAGVGETGYGLGVCIGDYNQDGFPDIYVSNFGPQDSLPKQRRWDLFGRYPTGGCRRWRPGRCRTLLSRHGRGRKPRPVRRQLR